MYRNRPSSKILSLAGCSSKFSVRYYTYYEWYNNGKSIYPSMCGTRVEKVKIIE